MHFNSCMLSFFSIVENEQAQSTENCDGPEIRKLGFKCQPKLWKNSLNFSEPQCSLLLNTFFLPPDVRNTLRC